jgi:hypothetical protein
MHTPQRPTPPRPQDSVAPYTDQWFNTSQAAGEVSPYGLPYAFFPQVWGVCVCV